MEGLEIEMPEIEGEEGANGTDEMEVGGVKLLPDTDSEEEDEESSDESSDEDIDYEERKKKRKAKSEKKKAKELARQGRWDVNKTPLQPMEKAVVREFPTSSTTMLKLCEYTTLDCEGAAVFEGFPSKGLTSSMVSKFLVDELKLPLVGEIHCGEFPTVCRVFRGQASESCRIYANKNVVVFTSEMLLDSALAHVVSHAIVDFAERHKCKLIFTCESVAKDLDMEDIEEDARDGNLSQEQIMEKVMEKLQGSTVSSDKKKDKKERKKDKKKEKERKEKEKKQENDEEPHLSLENLMIDGKKAKTKDVAALMGKEEEKENDETKPEIMYVATTDDLVGQLRDMKFHRVRNAIIGGVTGALLSRVAPNPNIGAVCFIGRFNPMLTDARSAVMITEAIIAVMSKAGKDISIDMKPLEKKADKVEGKIRKAVEEMKTGVGKRKAPTNMYM